MHSGVDYFSRVYVKMTAVRTAQINNEAYNLLVINIGTFKNVFIMRKWIMAKLTDVLRRCVENGNDKFETPINFEMLDG